MDNTDRDKEPNLWEIAYQNRVSAEIYRGPETLTEGGSSMTEAGAVQFLRKQVVRAQLDAATDAQLLQRFVDERDEAAFAALVRRHGAMVWGVCKRALGHHQNAEDAFQATFLVLVRKAGSVRPQGVLGNWLYGVAHQVAVKARAMNAKRMSREKQLSVPIDNAPAREPACQELQTLLDQELALLPGKYREVIVLCDLEGKTRKEAACCLAVPEGTVAGRHARARAMLARRLARHGLVLSGALSPLLFHATASALPPASVVAATIESARVLLTGGAVPTTVAALIEGVVNALVLSKLKSAMYVALVGLAASFGVGLAAHAPPAGPGAGPGPGPDQGRRSARAPAPKAAPRANPKPATDQERMVGTWFIVKDSLRKNETWIIDKEHIRMGVNLLGGMDGLLRSYHLGPSKDPRQIDIRVRKKAGGPPLHVLKGIYAFDGDKLRLCLAAANKARPTAFPKRPKAGEVMILQRVFTPAEVATQKLEGRLCVEFRVGAAGRTTSPVKQGERPGMLLQPDQAKTKPDQFLAFLVGPTTAELRKQFPGGLQELFVGKVARVTGQVTKAPVRGGSAYQMAVTSAKDVEVVQAPKKAPKPPDDAPAVAARRAVQEANTRKRSGAGGDTRPAAELSDYLADDGKLKSAVTIRTGPHGLVTVRGPKAEVWRLEPTGEWTGQLAVKGKLRTEAKGKLRKEQVAALARQLAKQDFKSLPRRQGYESQKLDEVYLYVVIGFGKKQAELNYKIGETPLAYRPKPGDPKAAAWSRFMAVQHALADLLEIKELQERKKK